MNEYWPCNDCGGTGDRYDDSIRDWTYPWMACIKCGGTGVGALKGNRE